MVNMILPGFQDFFYPILKYSSEYSEISLNEIRDFLTKHFNLTDKDKAERVPSGVQTKFDNRIYWTKTYLSKANLIENTKRSHFKITEKGRIFFKKFNSSITINDLKTINEFKKFQEGDTITDKQLSTSATNETKTPLENFDENYNLIKHALASELLEKILENTWHFFEDLVIDLMVKMGYGSTRIKIGNSIKRNNDEGIDGIIYQDKLGLDLIYLQAKMWKEKASIGRPEIQKFVGALHGQKAKKGVFITTSNYTNEAKDFAKNIESKIILIDGNALTNLMIEYNVGVTPIETYQIKKIDIDYFEK